MRSNDLRRQLRQIILATPFVAGIACGGGTAATRESVYPVAADAGNVCYVVCDAFADAGETVRNCSFDSLDGGPAVDCTFGPPVNTCGRRPAALLASSGAWGAHPVGALFADASRLEAASIDAFRILARELASCGAPAGLVRRTERAAADEVRHAGVTAHLARRYGAEPIAPAFGTATGPRSLAAIALENAAEGCVRETYGAIVAGWQARHAKDRSIARAMAAIADDEARHAELAWDISAWAEGRLSNAERRCCAAARSEALVALLRDLRQQVALDCVEIAGFPTPEVGQSLARGLARELRLQA